MALRSFALLLALTTTAPAYPGATPEPPGPVVAAPAPQDGVVGSGPAAPRADSVPPMRRRDLPVAGPFDAERAPFKLRLAGRDRRIAYRIAAVPVLPGEVLELEVDGGREGHTLRYGGGRVEATTAAGWRWRSPAEPGVVALRVEAPAGAIHLNVFVMVPRSAIRDGYLNGYRMGAYRASATHPVPRGFVQAHAADEDLLVSPHFTLGQFLCKQPGSPRYVVVSIPLIVKLEAVLARVALEGHAASTLHLMSAYRTPWYNRSIGNTTTLSRHLYGEAADIFVDADGDGYMDDLNGDGRRDVADARLLFDLVEQVERAERSQPRIIAGGMKAYRKNQVRGPFLHVDVRGRSARW